MSKRNKFFLRVIFICTLVLGLYFKYSENSPIFPFIDKNLEPSQGRDFVASHQINNIVNQVKSTSIVDRFSNSAPKILSENEKKLFLSEVHYVFSILALSTLDKDTLKNHLSKLNERGEAGLNAVVQILETTPTTDDRIRERISLIDYLVYRSKFDQKSLEKLKFLASIPIDPSAPLRYRAVLLAEKAEIVGGLSGLDWVSASKLIELSKDSLERTLMAHEAYENLVSKGANTVYATSLIREVYPKFNHQE